MAKSQRLRDSVLLKTWQVKLLREYKQSILFFQGFVREMVLCGGDQFVHVWFAASDSIKRNHAFREVHVGASEFVRPRTFHELQVSHDFHVLLVCRSANENYLALWSCRIVQLPAFRDLPSRRRRFISFVIFCSHSIDILIRLPLYFSQVVKVKPVPHSTFPTSVVIFDRRLKASFSRRHEHGDHAQTQTTSHDFSKRVRPSTPWKIVVLSNWA